MRVTIGQINSTNGDIAGNVQRIIAAIEKAKADGSDMIVFPEVITHGYTSQDWFQDADIIEHSLDPLEEIIPHTKGIVAVVGTIRPNGDNDGRRLFNSAAVIHDGKLLGFADKTLLPEYDVFDDPRYFEPNPADGRLYEVNGVKIGVVVCEDFWNDKTFWKDRLYENDPTDEVIALGPDVVVSVNASPYNKGKIKLRCDMVAHRAKANKVPIVFVNLVGGNDGIIFDGASLIADQESDIILQAAAFEESLRRSSWTFASRRPRNNGGEIDSIHGRSSSALRIRTEKHFSKAVLACPAASIRPRCRLPTQAKGQEFVRGRAPPVPAQGSGRFQN